MYLRHENVLDRLMEWHRVFTVLRDRVLSDAASFDVYLDCSDENTCRYYMVDHGNKTICWLRQRTTADLGTQEIRNKLHLREPNPLGCRPMVSDDVSQVLFFTRNTGRMLNICLRMIIIWEPRTQSSRVHLLVACWVRTW